MGGPGVLARHTWRQVSRAELAEPSVSGRFQNGWHSPHTLPTTWLAILTSGRPAVGGCPVAGENSGGPPVLTVGFLENSCPRGQRTRGNPSCGLCSKAKGVQYDPAPPLHAQKGVNEGGFHHSQTAIQLVTAVFTYSSSSFLVINNPHQ